MFSVAISSFETLIPIGENSVSTATTLQRIEHLANETDAD